MLVIPGRPSGRTRNRFSGIAISNRLGFCPRVRGQPRNDKVHCREAPLACSGDAGYMPRATVAPSLLLLTLRVLRLGRRGCEAATEVDRVTVARQRLRA